MSLTGDYQALRAAVLANPLEDTPRLVLADWLDENGAALPCPVCGKWKKNKCPVCRDHGSLHQRHAALIRGQFELERVLADYPHHTWDNLDMVMDPQDAGQQATKHRARPLLGAAALARLGAGVLLGGTDLRPHPNIPARAVHTAVAVEDTLYAATGAMARFTYGIRLPSGRRPVASYMATTRVVTVIVRRGFVEGVRLAQQHLGPFRYAVTICPLRGVEVTDARPWFTGGVFSWYSDCMPRAVADDFLVRSQPNGVTAVLYQSVFAELPRARDEVPAGNTYRACYASEDDAREALSRAAVNYMRRGSGLVPMRWGDGRFSER